MLLLYVFKSEFPGLCLAGRPPLCIKLICSECQFNRKIISAVRTVSTLAVVSTVSTASTAKCR